MESPISGTTSVGIASCVIASGCFFLSYITNTNASKIQDAKQVACIKGKSICRNVLQLLLLSLGVTGKLRLLYLLTDLRKISDKLLVVVTGKVWSAKPLIAELSEHKCVIKQASHGTSLPMACCYMVTQICSQ